MADPTILISTDAKVTISLMPYSVFSEALVEILKEVNGS